MGNCDPRAETAAPPILQSRTQFALSCVIGKGGFGKVWKGHSLRSKCQFAMKEMHKGRVLLKRSVHSVMNERKILEKLKHGFLVNMHAAFQDGENLYLVMDYMAGGDLRFHLNKARKFTEEQTKFFVACILVGLEYIHKNSVMHRDLKPENLVLDSTGYLRITDFGVARELKDNNSLETSGTPGYMAPEVMTRSNHSYTVDFYALGVITHEFMLGKRPYLGTCRKEIREGIMARQVQLTRQDLPSHWSLSAADFINQLLQRKPTSRLGSNGGAKEVMSHPWFAGFPWKQLLSKDIKPPLKPGNGDNFDPKLVTAEWKDCDKAISTELARPGADSYFDGYFYDPLGRKPLPELPPVSLGEGD